MKEETGLDITVGKSIGESITPTSNSKSRWYECFAYTDKVVPGSDLEKLMWIYWKTVPHVVSLKSIHFWPKEVADYFDND